MFISQLILKTYTVLQNIMFPQNTVKSKNVALGKSCRHQSALNSEGQLSNKGSHIFLNKCSSDPCYYTKSQKMRGHCETADVLKPEDVSSTSVS